MPVVRFDEIGSTNAEALARATGPAPCWFVATRQTQGRGRRGRAWSSEPGNLYASLLLVQPAPAARLPELCFVASLALHDAVRDVTGIDPLRIGLKWPNDVQIDGAKLAGILLEAQKGPDGSMAVIIGMGVNVVAAPEGLPYPAASIAALGWDVSPETILATLTDEWVDAIELWDNGRNVADILALWRESAAGIGAPVAVSRDGEVVRGVFETIDDAGRLIVRANDNSRVAITAGDVHFGATASVRA